MRKPSKAALFAAARAWDASTVRAILATAPDLVSASDPGGRGALHLACAVKGTAADGADIATVTALLTAGAELERAVPMEGDEGDFRATALWYAAARGENLSLVEFLLRRGADASPALWSAVWQDNADLCRVLLAAGPRLDLRAHGETPLFYAARLKRLKTLDLLIEAGADPTIRDEEGRDAVQIARERRLPKPFIDRLAAGGQTAS